MNKGRIQWVAYYCVLLCCCFLPSRLLAEINVPPKNAPYKPIVITVKPAGIPANAQVRGSVTCLSADLLLGPSEGVWHCWAAPGTHSVVASGVWVLTRDVQLGEELVPVLVDFGQYSESASFVVAEDENGPDPPPPPGDKWLVIIEESSKRTSQQANQYTALRTMGAKRVIIADQHDDSDVIRRYVDMIPNGTYLPVVFVVDKDGKVLKQVPLPDNLQDILELQK